MPQRAGRFDRRITIQVDSGTATRGQHVPSWADLHTVFADFTPVSMNEQYRSGQRLATEAGTFRIRWRSDFSPDPKLHRISYHDKYWGITGVQELGRREGWDLFAEVRASSGGG
jgi:SPP1 family predicted phage head-tail adaptor